MKINIRELNFEEILESRFKAKEEYDDATIIYERFAEGEDEFKSKLMAKISKENSDLSRNELLDAAKSTDEWTEYLNQKSEAKKEMLHLENIYETWASSFMAKCIMEKQSIKNEGY